MILKTDSFGLDERKENDRMKKLSILIVMLAFASTNAYSWLYRHSFMVDRTIYPFPMSYSISDLQIKGDVTEVTETSYLTYLKFGEETKIKKLESFKYKFENGVLVSFEKYDKYGTNTTFFKYDQNNRLVHAIYGKSEDDPYARQISYYYDEKGRLKKVDDINVKKEIIGRWVFEYTTDKNFKIYEYEAFTGRMSDEYYYVNGLLVKNIYYYSSGNETSTCFYTYNSQRRLIKESQGNRLETTSYNSKGWDAKYDYTIDSKGNWTMKREKAKPGEYYELTERSITYK